MATNLNQRGDHYPYFWGEWWSLIERKKFTHNICYQTPLFICNKILDDLYVNVRCHMTKHHELRISECQKVVIPTTMLYL